MSHATLMPVSRNNFRAYNSLLGYYCTGISWVQKKLTQKGFTGFHRFLRIKLIGNCNMGTQILESFKAFLVFSEQSVCIRQPNLAFLWFLPIFNFCCYY